MESELPTNPEAYYWIKHSKYIRYYIKSTEQYGKDKSIARTKIPANILHQIKEQDNVIQAKEIFHQLSKTISRRKFLLNIIETSTINHEPTKKAFEQNELKYQKLKKRYDEFPDHIKAQAETFASSNFYDNYDHQSETNNESYYQHTNPEPNNANSESNNTNPEPNNTNTNNIPKNNPQPNPQPRTYNKNHSYTYTTRYDYNFNPKSRPRPNTNTESTSRNKPNSNPHTNTSSGTESKPNTNNTNNTSSGTESKPKPNTNTNSNANSKTNSNTSSSNSSTETDEAHRPQRYLSKKHKDILKKYNINTKKEWRTWLVKNHPDRNSKINIGIVQDIIEAGQLAFVT